ncbi:helix-turn-helix domain-containing protein [Streptomyces sp. NBC_00647]
MKQPAISRIEGGGTTPTVPLLRRLAAALDAHLNVEFVPHGTASQEKPEQRTAIEAAARWRIRQP